MYNEADLGLFYDLFRGNETCFVKHQAPFSQKEGKLRPAWCGFAVYNKRSPLPEGKEAGELIPVTKELYREHLDGGDGLAIAPLRNIKTRASVCCYAAIDIDIYDVNYTWLVRRLYSAGFKFAAFLSKSGGLHIYFFFKEPESGAKAIEALERIVEVYGLKRLFVNGQGKGKVEIFPKQAVFMPGHDTASCLFLPFYNAKNKSRQNMLTAEGKLVGISKALPIIESMFTSAREINSVLDGLPYGDAPYCVQMLLLTGALAENDGRNNFLFCAAVYLKKKYDDGFTDALYEMNDCLEAPLEQKDVDSIYKSVTTNGYDSYSCKKSPCSDYCDKRLCALREYGAGRQRDSRFTGADCWGDLYMVRSVKGDPYYLWQVRVNPDEKFKTVRVDNLDDLHNQSAMQKRCWRDLNWAPFRIKDNDWVATVNNAMTGIDDRTTTVSKEMDTTELGEIYDLFLRYLTHSQIHNGKPQMVRMGRVYHAEGAYYFTTGGIREFLRTKKFSMGRINLHDQLQAYGCFEGELAYKTAKGTEKTVKCWKKLDDEELLEMDAFYDEVYDGDADTPRKSASDNDQEEGNGDEETKF